MRRILIASLLMLLAACETVPITGRQQISIHGAAEMNALGAREYRRIIDESDVVSGTREARLVSEVGNKIKNAVANYFSQNGQSDRLQGYRWEFRLIDDDEPNAFCLPGGKVAVYSGILDITQTEAGLAVVMGHEVAHAIANHGNERMSQTLLVDLAGAALSVAVADEDTTTQFALQSAFGFGSALGVLLPFSRLHESEADRLGLIFMAMAGYDPHEAPKFWRRMAAAKKEEGGEGFEFMSTHPSDETRVKDLENAIVEAMTYYHVPGRSQVAQPSTAQKQRKRRLAD
ncbi:MAG: M48 family metallopeptidase [Alphaproteobacteria bacterium]|nr:M48 family metallopeptidase [Alphaproteobacteria bacterium]